MLTSIQYGNQAELELKYSHACLLIRIPRFEERFGPQFTGNAKLFRGIERNPASNEKYDSSTDSDEEMTTDGDDHGGYYCTPTRTQVLNENAGPMTLVEKMLERQRQRFGEWEGRGRRLGWLG